MNSVEKHQESYWKQQGGADNNSRNIVGEQFDDIAEKYDEDLQQLLSPYMVGSGTEKFAEYKVQLVHNLLHTKPLQSILDFGCGTGRSIQHLREYFGQKILYYGCDVSHKSIQEAKKINPNVRYFTNDSITEFEGYWKSTAEGGYDLVFIACVLHHIPPDERISWIRAILKNLNKNGYLVVFEHNLKNPLTKKIVTWPDNLVDDVHWMLSPMDLDRLFQEIDIKIKYIWKGYTLFSQLRYSWIIEIEKALKWCPLGAQHCLIVQKLEENF